MCKLLHFKTLWTLYIVAHANLFVLGQTHGLFQWTFSNENLSTNLPACAAIRIAIKPFNESQSAPLSKPPYYMRSFAVGGVPATTLIGTDDNDLAWTVAHPAGTKLYLNVVDADGSSGGVAGMLYSVIGGQTTSCIASPPISNFRISANVTGNLLTCQPWGITIEGGVPPYNVTLLQPNSPIVTNLTMGSVDDRLTYINRANTDSTLLAAVSDSTGVFANGTLSINTKGPSDVAICNGPTVSGNNTLVEQQITANTRSANLAKQQQSVTIGVVVTLLIVVVITSGAGFWFFRRRQRRRLVVEPEQGPKSSFIKDDTIVEPYPTSIPFQDISPAMRKQWEAFGNRRISIPRNSPMGTPTSSLATTLSTPVDSKQRSPGEVDQSTPGTRPGFASFPTTSIRRGDSTTALVLVNSVGGSKSVGERESVELPPPYQSSRASSRATSISSG